ncbi:MerR family transcriptional regulator [Algivirga pacifica]|uniref:MerR family transcriptional regulator n=1 Tax=Algivirga pacifica TaxID=1162670 RepID=A0ABP9DAN8_9BACT
MNTYSIKDLEHMTGIKAHTIRVWEQRYQIITPKRTNTNIRYYDSEDLKYMLNVALLNNNGFKISKIATMSKDEIHEAVLKVLGKRENYQDQINGLAMAMIDLDEERFEKIISTNVLQIGFEETMFKVVFPFLARVGFLWQTDAINPCQEHFISNLIRQKIIVAIDGQVATVNPNYNKYLLFLPEGEWHEIGIMFAVYLIKKRGNKVIYLGQNLPLEDIKKAYEIYKTDYLCTALTASPDIDCAQNYINELSQEFPDAGMIISGYQVVGQELEGNNNVFLVPNFFSLIDFVEEDNAYKEKAVENQTF